MVGRAISHYKILAKLGEGGMGVVYKAQDTKLKRVVALKFLAAHLLGDGEEKARFLREAQAAAALDHPNICTIYEVDEVDGKTFIAMAYIEGQTIQQKVGEGRLSLREALDIALQTAQGLQAAHENGVVHRDIKPGNIIVTEKQRASILDFGLAQITGESRLTKTGMTLGTAAFMSPEQTLGRALDHRTDIWSLGVVLYEMVAGQLPFVGEYELARMYSIANDEPPALASLQPRAPAALQSVIDTALAKEKDDRYASVAEMITDLQGILGGLGESGIDATALPTPSSAHATLKLPAKAQRRTPPSRGTEQTPSCRSAAFHRTPTTPIWPTALPRKLSARCRVFPESAWLRFSRRSASRTNRPISTQSGRHCKSAMCSPGAFSGRATAFAWSPSWPMPSTRSSSGPVPCSTFEPGQIAYALSREAAAGI